MTPEQVPGTIIGVALDSPTAALPACAPSGMCMRPGLTPASNAVGTSSYATYSSATPMLSMENAGVFNVMYLTTESCTCCGTILPCSNSTRQHAHRRCMHSSKLWSLCYTAYFLTLKMDDMLSVTGRASVWTLMRRWPSRVVYNNAACMHDSTYITNMIHTNGCQM